MARQTQSAGAEQAPASRKKSVSKPKPGRSKPDSAKTEKKKATKAKSARASVRADKGALPPAGSGADGALPDAAPIEPPHASVSVRTMELEDMPRVFALGEKLFTAERWPVLYRTWDEYEIVI